MPIPTTTQIKSKTAIESRLRGDTDPADMHFAITKSDTVQQPYFARGIYVGVGGDISVEMKNPTTTDDYITLTYKNAQAGSILPISPRRILAATTATDLIGLL